MISNFNKDPDHDNDIQYNAYLLYKNKLINAKSYEILIQNDIKILLPTHFDIEQIKTMNCKNKIIQNKKGFKDYKLSFKEYTYIDGLDYLLGLDKALDFCEKEYQIKKEYLKASLTIFCFQIFTIEDVIAILTEYDFKLPKSIFLFLEKNNFLTRIDDISNKVKKNKRVYVFSNKGVSMIKLFYETLEKHTVFDFKFKTKNEVLIDSILKKYE